MASTVTGDQGADSPLETNVGVRVASQPCFHEREAGAGALARRAQETPGRNIDLVQVCHTHERLGSDSEVAVLEQVSTGAWPFSTTDAQKKTLSSDHQVLLCLARHNNADQEATVSVQDRDRDKLL